MAHWTTRELRQLKQAHDGARPRRSELAAMFARHSPRAVYERARVLGLRVPANLSKKRRPAAYWLKIAHRYYAKREMEMRV